MEPPALSVIVPVRNELPGTLENLAELAELTGVTEVIAVDFSDLHATVDKLNELEARIDSLRVARTERSGRAVQMNRGAALAAGRIYWFVHADTSPPDGAAELILQSVSPEKPWGRFDVRFDDSSARMRLIAFAMNLRSGLTSVCTGDQAIFVTRALFHDTGGFPDLPIMEDIALSKLLKRGSRAIRIREPVTTSARRWKTRGYVKTILIMWLMRFLYWIGVSPRHLAKLYR